MAPGLHIGSLLLECRLKSGWAPPRCWICLRKSVTHENSSWVILGFFKGFLVTCMRVCVLERGWLGAGATLKRGWSTKKTPPTALDRNRCCNPARLVLVATSTACGQQAWQLMNKKHAWNFSHCAAESWLHLAEAFILNFMIGLEGINSAFIIKRATGKELQYVIDCISHFHSPVQFKENAWWGKIIWWKRQKRQQAGYCLSSNLAVKNDFKRRRCAFWPDWKADKSNVSFCGRWTKHACDISESGCSIWLMYTFVTRFITVVNSEVPCEAAQKLFVCVYVIWWIPMPWQSMQHSEM